MAKTLRIHVLAKELGVKSKVLVEKCDAEGVPDITNHMSVVKLGLAATIRQWFSTPEEDHSHDTAVEEAQKVDVKKVRKKVAKKKATTKEADSTNDASGDAEGGTATLVEEAPAAPKKKSKVAKKKKATIAAKPAEEVVQAVTEAQAPATQQAEQSEQSEKTDQAQDAALAEVAASPQASVPAVPTQPAGRLNVPDRPTVIKPAGEQLVTPKKAMTRGPKVIRIEKPDPIAPPRSRSPRPPRSGAGAGAGGGGGLPSGEIDGVTRSRGPARGGGVKRGDGAPAAGKAGRSSRRSLSNRRSRGNDQLLTGPQQMSQKDIDEMDARLRGAAGYVKKRRQNFNRTGHIGQAAQSALVTGGKVEIEEPITIKALSSATGIKASEVVKFLFKQGHMATVNSTIETEQAMEVCLDYDIELEVKEHETAAQKVEQEFDDRVAVDIQPRPPIVTILGHVDHGKTSLLDRIRRADVADHEDGGITQHVGAYRVTIEGSDQQEKTVVFQDTPGHAAFTAMRARGAQMTDIVVLIVAADDGVMPQTVESINHAKAAGVPVVVAVNKCDLPSFDDKKLQAIYGQLAEHGLNPTAWGGETEVIKTSAETGEGVSDLLETLDLQAEVLELTADFGGPGRGTVIEAEMQVGRGSVARVMVQDGTVKVGDFISIGRAFGRVRDITNDRNQSIQEAGPATPIELSGIDDMPDSGDKFYITKTLKKAEDVAKHFRDDERQQALASRTKVTLDNFAETIQAGKVAHLNVVVKADVQGSVETLRKSLGEQGNNEVAIRVIHGAVGGITESDVLLADASDAVILGFHVSITPAVRDIAEQRHVDIRMYRVIYDLIDEVKQSLEGMLAPETTEEEIGRAEVKEVFKIGKVGNIAGCLVTIGSITKGNKMRLVRDGVVVTEGRGLETLRRVKDEAKEVRAGTECGIRIDGFEDIKASDELICYKVTEVKRTLD